MTGGLLVVYAPSRGLAVQAAAWGVGWERRGPLLLGSRQDPRDRTPAVRQAQGSTLSITLFNFGWRMVKEGQPASGWGPARSGGRKAWTGFWEDESGLQLGDPLHRTLNFGLRK